MPHKTDPTQNAINTIINHINNTQNHYDNLYNQTQKNKQINPYLKNSQLRFIGGQLCALTQLKNYCQNLKNNY